MSSSYAAAISALSSGGSSTPPAGPQTSPDRTGRPAAFRPSSKSFHTPPAAHPRSHEPLGCFEEQQENPADYGIGEQHMHENAIVATLRVAEIFPVECVRPRNDPKHQLDQSAPAGKRGSVCKDALNLYFPISLWGLFVLQVVITAWKWERSSWTGTRWSGSWDGVTSPPCGSAGI